MLLLDTNVIVHAVYKGSQLHLPAATLMQRALREKGAYCIAPQNLIEFLSVVTRGRFVDPPMRPENATEVASTLFRSRRFRKIYPVRGTVNRAIAEGKHIDLTGTRWYDLYLAVTMRDNRVATIVTENIRDFRALDFISAIRIQDAQ
jgi:predicted nucleic acid-binding protein